MLLLQSLYVVSIVSTPVSHSRVPEALDERNKRPKLLNLPLDLLCHGQTAGDALEVFDALVHRLEGVADVGPQQLWINVDQRVIHPGVVPLEPVGCHDPQVLVGLKVSHQLTHLEREREREKEGERKLKNNFS